VGRHTATDGDPVHPVVAAALARRASDPIGVHRGSPSRGEGALGWPGEPSPGGGGLGWPGDLVPDRSEGPVSDEVPPARQGDQGQVENPALQVENPAPQLHPAGRRRGWRRLLGVRAA
jgi:hypothetical protein